MRHNAREEASLETRPPTRNTSYDISQHKLRGFLRNLNQWKGKNFLSAHGRESTNSPKSYFNKVWTVWYLLFSHQSANFVFPHEDKENVDPESDIREVHHDPVPVGAAHREADHLHRPVHAHDHEQLQVQAVSAIKVCINFHILRILQALITRSESSLAPRRMGKKLCMWQ